MRTPLAARAVSRLTYVSESGESTLRG
jgi:hypothetical protein